MEDADRVLRESYGAHEGHEEVRLEPGFRIDLLVNDKVIVEIKALSDVHFKQALTYLKLSDLRLGILVNFNVPRLKDNVRRIIEGQLVA